MLHITHIIPISNNKGQVTGREEQRRRRSRGRNKRKDKRKKEGRTIIKTLHTLSHNISLLHVGL
jgi:hypothetical protein